ncbi:hypothetical protein DAPPUDRAFT_109997 [Daphnia pulex]|uniref:G-protein coupled receptors family 1 profile domain-containing protein n=1 Tax=Daphnia pulex TaxID=6669 RepID=E9H4V8_DAPPU|nr:hypothetical protein DAPPUDRAFT_109997 [Daphnia pulex]|eukprot:EFX73285.1 hypothetical protein DAPPUDRAFT_109997 [Daphnia pulex]
MAHSHQTTLPKKKILRPKVAQVHFYIPKATIRGNFKRWHSSPAVNIMNGRCDQGETVLTETGDVFNPVHLDDTAYAIAQFVCCLVGIPLNLSIAITLIRHRRLRQKPRNIFLLGIIWSNLSFFIPAIIKLIYWGFYPVESLCRVYVALVGVPQGLLSLNMLLAVADRYLAINHPLLHREKMTVRFASVVIILSSISTVFFLKFVYIVGLAPLRCEVWLVHAKIILMILTIVFLSCATLYLVVYRQTQILLGTIFPSTNDAAGQRNGNQMECIELAVIGNESLNERVSTPITNDECSSIRPSSMSIHVNRRKLSQIDLETTRTLISGLTSLIITTLPPMIFVSSFLACRLVSQSECSHFNWLAPYMIELGLINVVCSPLIILIRNKDLRTALVG